MKPVSMNRYHVVARDEALRRYNLGLLWAINDRAAGEVADVICSLEERVGELEREGQAPPTTTPAEAPGGLMMPPVPPDVAREILDSTGPIRVGFTLPTKGVRCRAAGCLAAATHGPRGATEPVVCWGHAVDWPSTAPTEED